MAKYSNKKGSTKPLAKPPPIDKEITIMVKSIAKSIWLSWFTLLLPTMANMLDHL